MRIGFGVTALCNGLSGGGLDGIGNYTREIMSRIVSAPQVELVPFSFRATIPSDMGQGVQLSRYSVNTAWSVATGANFFGMGDLVNRVDLIHATDHYVPRCKPAPMVATLMDAIPLSHPQWLRSEFRDIKNFLWKRAANWADEVITISDYSKIELSKWTGIALNKITVIPLAVDERWFRSVSSEEFARVRQLYQLPETFFISVGTLQPRKNVESTIWAHRALSPAERVRTPLIIIGRAGWKCEEVMRLIEEDSASGAVRWLKHVPDKDLLPVLKLASALVFPSLGEGFGLPVLEAFAASVPVITSNTTSLPEVAGDAAISLNPLDIDAISKAMRQVLEDQSLVLMLKERGLARAKEFTWQACADATLQVYRKMLD
ncbi:glycosyltransferase family 4 protein [Zwartia sp.]|uniref:glycosyltransferase family 4 protein n=1 Tax=Zwartia sp. TaxID=2978004 RepID=UPI003BAE1723